MAIRRVKRTFEIIVAKTYLHGYVWWKAGEIHNVTCTKEFFDDMVAQGNWVDSFEI